MNELTIKCWSIRINCAIVRLHCAPVRYTPAVFLRHHDTKAAKVWVVTEAALKAGQCHLVWPDMMIVDMMMSDIATDFCLCTVLSYMDIVGVIIVFPVLPLDLSLGASLLSNLPSSTAPSWEYYSGHSFIRHVYTIARCSSLIGHNCVKR